MTGEEGFMLAICAEPERDDLRLIMADWFCDQGQDARGEFVRIQIELALLPPWHTLRLHEDDRLEIRPDNSDLRHWEDAGRQMRELRMKRWNGRGVSWHWPAGLEPGHSFDIQRPHPQGGVMTITGLFLDAAWFDERTGGTHFEFRDGGAFDRDAEKRKELKRRESELFQAAGPGQQEWFGPAHRVIPAGTEVASLLPWFRRGFVSRISCTSEEWLAHADTITDSLPVEEVELTTPMVVHFGPVRRTVATSTSRKEVLSRWTADVGSDHQLAMLKAFIADREAGTEAERYIMRDHEQRLDAARTTMGYLKMRWNRIRFKLPGNGFPSSHVAHRPF